MPYQPQAQYPYFTKMFVQFADNLLDYTVKGVINSQTTDRLISVTFNTDYAEGDPIPDAFDNVLGAMLEQLGTAGYEVQPDPFI